MTIFSGFSGSSGRTRAPARAAAAVLLACAWALSGCGADAPGEETPSTSKNPAPGPTSSTPGPTPTSTPEPPNEAPEPGSLDTPATRAGDLRKDSLPTPKRLGAGWRYTVDAGDEEEGYLGNGTPALARNPDEVAQAAVPFGCPRDGELPRPDHALEVDYSYRGVAVIAVRSTFDSPASARQFFETRAALLERCRGVVAVRAVGPLVSSVERRAAGVLVSDRTPESDGWAELAVQRRSDVVLVAAHAGLGQAPFIDPDLRAIVRAFTP